MSDPFRLAVQQLARFPGVGERTATRYAYWLLRQTPEAAEQIASAIQGLKASVHECAVCCDLTEREVCARCLDVRRDAGLICVVERPQDVRAIDGSGEFKGRFHVLHGALSPLDGVGPEDLRIRALLRRIGTSAPPGEQPRECILAMDPDVEGDATSLYLARLLKPLDVRVTRLAHGIAVGTEIEFADRVSLARAFEGRREIA